jgi:hypothetical protein
MTDLRPRSTAKSRCQVSFYHCALTPRYRGKSPLSYTLVAVWKATAPVKLPRLHCWDGASLLHPPNRHENNRVVFHLLHKILLAQNFIRFHLTYTTIA